MGEMLDQHKKRDVSVIDEPEGRVMALALVKGYWVVVPIPQ